MICISFYQDLPLTTFLRKLMKKILVLFHKKEAIFMEGHPCWQRHWQHQYEDIVLSKSDKSNPNIGLASLVMNILYIHALINNWDWGLDVFLCWNSSHSISQWQAHGLITAVDILNFVLSILCNKINFMLLPTVYFSVCPLEFPKTHQHVIPYIWSSVR